MRRWWRLFGCAVFLFGALPVQAALTLTDDAGRRVTLAAPAQRIVSLAPHITDMLLSLGARTQIVGVVDDHEVPGAYARSLSGLPVVADAGAVSEERLLAARPDLVLVWESGMSAARAQRLQALGLTVVYIEPATLDGIAANMELLGALSGHADAGHKAAGTLRGQLTALRQQYAAGRRLTAFYEVWLQPLYTVQGRHLVSQGLALCGADNIMPAGTVAAPLVNAEYVVRRDPDVILFGTQGQAASRAFWGRFGSLKAVRQGHLLPVSADALARPGPGLIQALGPLCGQLAVWRRQV